MEQSAEHQVCTNEFLRAERDVEMFFPASSTLKFAIFEMDYDGISRRRWLLNDFVWEGISICCWNIQRWKRFREMWAF